MRIVFIGPPGSGKGTQAARLIEYLRIPHLSTGEMLRQAKQDGTHVGLLAAQFMDDGRLVPDPIVVAIVGSRLQHSDCAAGCLFDGFPRTVGQAVSLDDYLRQVGTPIDAVLQLAVDDEALLARLSSRGRDDDEPDTIRCRLRQYAEQTRPLADYYARRGLLHTIDGIGSPDEVFDRIKNVLGAIKARE